MSGVHLASIVTEIQTFPNINSSSTPRSKWINQKYHNQTTFSQGDASGLLLFVGCVCVNFSVVHLPFRMTLVPLPLKPVNYSLGAGPKHLHLASETHISINRQVTWTQTLPKSFLHTLCRTILTYLSFTGPLSTPPLPCAVTSSS